MRAPQWHEAGVTALWWRILRAHLLAILLAILTIWCSVHAGLSQVMLPWYAFATYAVIALGVAYWMRLPIWWYPLLAGDVPALIWLDQLQLPPSVFLVVFLILWLFYRDNQRERVPLYLTGKAATRVLDDWLQEYKGERFIDLGCGFAGVLCSLARRHPDIRFFGIESAPIPYLIARLRAARVANCQILWGSYWHLDCTSYDRVYAFLSPQPMPALWRKLEHELRPGSWFISHHFAVPGLRPDRVLQTGKDKGSLFFWKKLPMPLVCVRNDVQV